MGDKATGWLAALEAGGNLVVDAPWELQIAKATSPSPSPSPEP